MSQLTIIGFGRFGQTLYKLLRDDYDIVIYTRHEVKNSPLALAKNTRLTNKLREAYQSDTIFYAVPISAFETVIRSHQQYFEARHVLIDVLSVKLHPARVFKKYLSGLSTQALLTHPMFGPDSSEHGFQELPIVMNQFMTEQKTYDRWRQYFSSKQLQVVELTPERHDKIAANTQGLTHFIGRLLEQYKLPYTPIDTLGTQKLQAIEEQTIRDSWQLFNDLQHYNPYTRGMRLKLGTAYDTVYNKLLPDQVNPQRLTIGIQGGKGSFNEEAIRYWAAQSKSSKYTIKYLYTSERVLAELHAGKIDRGLFAIHNSVGGIVQESIAAMAVYKFKIVEELSIKIAHALMMRDDASYEQLTTIMAHPQVFAQCKSSLPRKYPHLSLISGEGDLIDHANVAKQLAAHKLPKYTATMGSKVLAELYHLTIVEDNLQDAAENYTSFLLISR